MRGIDDLPTHINIIRIRCRQKMLIAPIGVHDPNIGNETGWLIAGVLDKTHVGDPRAVMRPCGVDHAYSLFRKSKLTRIGSVNIACPDSGSGCRRVYIHQFRAVGRHIRRNRIGEDLALVRAIGIHDPCADLITLRGRIRTRRSKYHLLPVGRPARETVISRKSQLPFFSAIEADRKDLLLPPTIVERVGNKPVR